MGCSVMGEVEKGRKSVNREPRRGSQPIKPRDHIVTLLVSTDRTPSTSTSSPSPYLSISTLLLPCPLGDLLALGLAPFVPRIAICAIEDDRHPLVRGRRGGSGRSLDTLLVLFVGSRWAVRTSPRVCPGKVLRARGSTGQQLILH
jgi:hypothetical protein